MVNKTLSARDSRGGKKVQENSNGQIHITNFSNPMLPAGSENPNAVLLVQGLHWCQEKCSKTQLLQGKRWIRGPREKNLISSELVARGQKPWLKVPQTHIITGLPSWSWLHLPGETRTERLGFYDSGKKGNLICISLPSQDPFE